MKIGGARAESFSAIRKRALAQAGAQATSSAAPADKTAFLGLTEADLTPAVQGAIKTLLTEVDDLRGEVSRLKGRLSEVEALADRDVLTPLLNRRAFVRELHRVGAFSARYGSPASLVYFDLDGFKAVNDTWGHDVGDQVLMLAGGRLAGCLRGGDLVARLGGDEFVVVVEHLNDASDLLPLVHRIERAMSTPFELATATVTIGASIGVASGLEASGAAELLGLADRAMYARKRERSGRSTVSAAI